MTDEQMEYIIDLLYENIDELDNMSDEIIDKVILYLQKEILKKETLLKQINEEY